MAQAPMGAPQGIRLSQLLALLQQGPQQQPQMQRPDFVVPPLQQGARNPQQEAILQNIPEQLRQPSVPFHQALQGGQEPPAAQQPQAPQRMAWRGAGMGGGLIPDGPPPGITSGRMVNPKIGSVLQKTPMDILGGIGNPVNALPKDYFPSLRTDGPKAAPQTPQAAPQAPAGPKIGSLFERLDEERGGSKAEMDLAGMQGPGPTAQMFTSAAQEVMSRGVDTPDKADEALRMEFQDDPQIEEALAQAKVRYGQARERSGQGPGVLEYIGYALATLAGANPMQAAEAISRRGEKREDERLALQDLMGAQQMKVRNNQMNSQRADQIGADYQRMYAQQAKEQQRMSERGEDKNFDRLKAGRGAALQRMNQLQQAVQYSQNPAEKKALQMELDQLKRRAQFFGRQLGEPEVDEQGKPIGQASPDAMRLLGLG